MVQFSRGFKAQANRIAVGLRKQAGLAETAPLDPRDVFRCLSIQVVPLEVWPESHWPRFLLIKGDGLRSYTA